MTIERPTEPPPEQLAEGKQIFRFDTFGDEAFWTDTLRIHEVIQSYLSPPCRVAADLKVDADAPPRHARKRRDPKLPHAVPGELDRPGLGKVAHQRVQRAKLAPFDHGSRLGSKREEFLTNGYDAGTEASDQLYTHVVDPCGGIGPRSAAPDGQNLRTATPGGVIASHPGIQAGVGDLARPSTHGPTRWRGSRSSG